MVRCRVCGTIDLPDRMTYRRTCREYGFLVTCQNCTPRVEPSGAPCLGCDEELMRVGDTQQIGFCFDCTQRRKAASKTGKCSCGPVRHVATGTITNDRMEDRHYTMCRRCGGFRHLPVPRIRKERP